MILLEDFKQNISKVFFAIAVTIIYALFPVDDFFQHMIVFFVFFVLAPTLYNSFFSNNVSIEDVSLKKELIWVLLMVIISTFLAYFVVKIPYLNQKYLTLPWIFENFKLFMGYELLFVFLISLVSQYFLIGFLFFSLSKVFNRYFAIFVQLILVGVLFFVGSFHGGIGFLFFIFSPIAILVGMKTKSYFYSALVQAIFVLMVDILHKLNV